MRKLSYSLLLFFTACNQKLSDEELAARSGIPPTKIRYFPPASSQNKAICFRSMLPSREPAVNGFASRWFSQQLAAAREPSLFLASEASIPAGLTAIRFTWLRTFDAPAFFRISKIGDRKFRLIAKELSGSGGYLPGIRKRTVVRELIPSEVRALTDLLKQTRFFRLPPTDCTLGMDGSEWIFEGIDDGGYHLLSRWSPVDGPSREVGEFMMKLSGWDFDRVY